MKKIVLGALFAVLLIFSAAACGGGNDNNNAGNKSSSSGGGDTSAANKIFQQNCAACHGNNLQGKNGPNLQTIGSELTKDQILKQIKNGGGGMPGDIISGKDAELVAAWLANKK